MDNRAPDIQELEHLRSAGGSYDELSDKAIEIAERLIEEMKRLGGIKDPPQHEVDTLNKECDAFEAVLGGIEKGRGPEALKRFKTWGEKIQDDLLSFQGTGGINCDTHTGPCSCGAWHKP